ncbi:hypothetical protein AVEN_227955-1 [Araneus ventricosus]|uniref:Uncharacterized protein n=1 Tax=Araneus ventricosus TaxID=182803 RepID=A0A4Y2NJG6_ARAVE|nr:hypothetical protein AVEN_227955-1 [Araneus ventricosus]
MSVNSSGILFIPEIQPSAFQTEIVHLSTVVFFSSEQFYLHKKFVSDGDFVLQYHLDGVLLHVVAWLTIGYFFVLLFLRPFSPGHVVPCLTIGYFFVFLFLRLISPGYVVPLLPIGYLFVRLFLRLFSAGYVVPLLPIGYFFVLLFLPLFCPGHVVP